MTYTLEDGVTPAPGSPEAAAEGCRCPTIDNEYGRGYHYTPDRPQMWVFSGDCTFHEEEWKRLAGAAEAG